MEKFINSLPEDGKKALADEEEYLKTYKVKLQEWKGVQLIPFHTKESAQFAYEEWSPRAGDVFVATYPKAGTHWMEEIARQIIYMGDENYDLMTARGTGQLKSQEYLEFGPASKFVVADYFPCRRIFVTHLCEQLVNYDKIKKNGAKVIYVYRNPKDLALSYYHFTMKLPYPEELKYMRRESWEEYLQALMSGQIHSAVPLGEWYPYHIKSWIKHRGDGTTLFVAFEDLKKDLPSEVTKIADFLGVQRSDEEVQEITRRCSFATMKEVQKHKTFSSMIYRKGQVGEWKERFTAAQSEMMDEKLKEELKGVDITFTYEI